MRTLASSSHLLEYMIDSGQGRRKDGARMQKGVRVARVACKSACKEHVVKKNKSARIIDRKIDRWIDREPDIKKTTTYSYKNPN